MSRRSMRCCIAWKNADGFRAAGWRRRVNDGAVTTSSRVTAEGSLQRSAAAGNSSSPQSIASRVSNVPDWKPHIKKRLASLGLEPTREAEIVEEFSQHLEDRHRELLASGIKEDEATRAVLADLNESELVAKELRRVDRYFRREPVVLGTRRTNMLNDLRQDLRYGARMFIKKPGFTLIAIITLALGVGANTAIFSVINAVLLRSLPFASPERLVAIGSAPKTDRSAFGTLSYPDFVDLQTKNDAFERLAAYRTRGFTMLSDSGALRLRGAIVTSELFNILGIHPLRGRTFEPAEDRPGGGRAVILN